MSIFAKSAISACVVSALSTAAMAQQVTSPTPPDDPRQQTWSTRCTGSGRAAGVDCVMEQTIVLRETGQQLVVVTLRVPAETRKPVVMFKVPLGLSLTAGLVHAVDDGQQEKLEFQTCSRDGCYAAMPVSEALLSAMRRGTTLSLSFQNMQKKTISVPVSLSGFTAAYSSIE